MPVPRLSSGGEGVHTSGSGGCPSESHSVSQGEERRLNPTQLRKRLNSEMALLPIVKSTDGGGLTCAFMFPTARGSPTQSSSTAPTPVAVSHDVPEVDVAEAIDRARTETPQEVDDPEDVEKARGPGFVSDVKHSSIIPSPSEDITVPGEVDSNNDWFPSHISVLSEGGHSPEHGWAVGNGVEEVSIPDHHVVCFPVYSPRITA